MTAQEYKDLDLTAIETEARKMRARFIADFFSRKTR